MQFVAVMWFEFSEALEAKSVNIMQFLSPKPDLVSSESKKTTMLLVKGTDPKFELDGYYVPDIGSNNVLEFVQVYNEQGDSPCRGRLVLNRAPPEQTWSWELGKCVCLCGGLLFPRHYS